MATPSAVWPGGWCPSFLLEAAKPVAIARAILGQDFDRYITIEP
ncbi:MAG TPA: hypothetical protein VGS96_15365 [Thermoanaerobaculia bacterium]|nr:hypothetical protein [Thermoanaerobaculia bacterium]